MSDTPASISAEMREADAKLKELADTTVWFKAQRDWWRGQLAVALARATALDKGPAGKVKEAALVAVTDNLVLRVTLPWVANLDLGLSLPDAIKYFDSSYDLINQRYEYYSTHLMTLMARNKNVLVEYNTTGKY